MYAARSMDGDLALVLGQAFSFRDRTRAPLRQIGGVVARAAAGGKLEWDRFAALTDVSAQADSGHLRAQALVAARRLRTFEFFEHTATGQEKIAQCAVLRRGRDFIIQDGLQLAPGHQDKWLHVMRALLARLGPGTYSYGGGMSCEPSRAAQFSGLNGVTVDHVRPFAVQGVEFAKWPSWDRYWAKVSDSVRYESKYAPERVPGLRLEHFSGLRMLKAIPAITGLQRASYTRKSIGYDRWKQTLRYAYYMARCRRSLEVVLAVADAGTLAAYYGARLGGRRYYIFGGQKAGSSGANWYLLKEMTRTAFESAPDGRFIMGNVDYAIHDEATGGGLLRARRALRVSDFETSMVTFRYRP